MSCGEFGNINSESADPTNSVSQPTQPLYDSTKFYYLNWDAGKSLCNIIAGIVSITICPSHKTSQGEVHTNLCHHTSTFILVSCLILILLIHPSNNTNTDMGEVDVVLPNKTIIQEHQTQGETGVNPGMYLLS